MWSRIGSHARDTERGEHRPRLRGILDRIRRGQAHAKAGQRLRPDSDLHVEVQRNGRRRTGMQLEARPGREQQARLPAVGLEREELLSELRDVGTVGIESARSLEGGGRLDEISALQCLSGSSELVFGGLLTLVGGQ